MRTVFKLSLVLLLAVSSTGCASRQPAAPESSDSRIETPAETASGVEVHGSISTTISTEIK